MIHNILSLLKPKKIVVTHDGRFHADEIFAIATLSLFHKRNIRIIRTRDIKYFATADYVVDVGLHYNHSARAYDHHQKGGAGVRENNIPYASFGLIWKHYGKELCGSLELAEKIDQTLVQPIDANDNGVNIVDPIFENCVPYGIQSVVWTRLPSWNEEGTINLDREFKNLVSFAKEILKREIEKGKDNLLAKEAVVRAYHASKDKRIIVLEENYPFEETLVAFDEPLLVVSPRIDGTWRVGCIPIQVGTYLYRKPLPEAWAGFSGEALATMTGVPGALFCHRARFLAVAKDKASAIQLALITLKS